MSNIQKHRIGSVDPQNFDRRRLDDGKMAKFGRAAAYGS